MFNIRTFCIKNKDTRGNFSANFSLYRGYIKYVKELIVFNGAYTIKAIYSRTYSTGSSMVLSLY